MPEDHGKPRRPTDVNDRQIRGGHRVSGADRDPMGQRSDFEPPPKTLYRCNACGLEVWLISAVLGPISCGRCESGRGVLEEVVSR